MKGKRRYFTQMRRRLSKCRKRLDTLKKQGYHFSNDIYYDIESIEKKISVSYRSNRLKSSANPIAIGVVGFIVIIVIISNINPDILSQIFGIITKEEMKIAFKNLFEGSVINESDNITGTTTYSKGEIYFVQVRINDDSWQYAEGTSTWNYYLNISNLKNGNNTISVRFYTGKKFSPINKINFTINKKFISIKPTVEIYYPLENANLSDTININGIAKAGEDQVQKVEIRFNNYSSWQNVTDTTRWSYNWDTTTVRDGEYEIQVRSYDNFSYSEIRSINITVYQRGLEIPDFAEGQYFQIYFPPSKPIIPNHIYEMNGIHRGRKLDYKILSKLPIRTVLTLDHNYDWLDISIPEETIITQMDNITRNISISISISNNAPMNRLIPVTIYYEYGIFDPIEKPLLTTTGYTDVWIYTGQW